MALTQTVRADAPGIGFGDRLRRLRIDQGMDTRELGRELGISNATVSRFETAGMTPRNAPHIASSVQLRFGRRYPGLDLRHWLLTGEERDRESTGYQTRVKRQRLRLIHGVGGLPDGSARMPGESRPLALRSA